MDLLIDLIDFMVMRAQKTGFESEEQLQKYIRCCTRIIKLHPNALKTLLPLADENPAPAPKPEPAMDWGAA